MDKDKIKDVDSDNDSGFDYELFAKQEKEAAEKAAALQQTQIDSVEEQSVENGSGIKIDKVRSEVYEWMQGVVAALLVCVLAFAFFIRIIGVIGFSMEPSIQDGDSVVVSNLFYEPRQGDIVVLRKQSFQEEPIIKRVIAVGGQTVDINFITGIVYVDGEPLEEPYTAGLTLTPLDFDGMITVPENSLFVLGDNRNHSLDSRRDTIGTVDERYIIGRVLLRVFPLRSFGTID